MVEMKKPEVEGQVASPYHPLEALFSSLDYVLATPSFTLQKSRRKLRQLRKQASTCVCVCVCVCVHLCLCVLQMELRALEGE